MGVGGGGKNNVVRLPTFYIAKLGYSKNTTNIEFLHHFLKKGYVNISGGWREEESPVSNTRQP